MSNESPTEQERDALEAAATAEWHAMLAQTKTTRRHWVRDGLLVPSADLEKTWGCSRQALDQAAKQGEVFAIEVDENRYYPAVFTRVEMQAAKAVCLRLKGDDVVAMFIFWNKTHGCLGGLTPAEAIIAGRGDRVAQLADAWSAERGLTA